MPHDSADATPHSEYERPHSEYERERRRKRDLLRDAGHDVYGRRTPGVAAVASLTPHYDTLTPETPGMSQFTVSGRVVLKRDMGKLSFLTIRDDTGDVQVGLARDRLADDVWLVRSNLDLGDVIVVTGTLGLTKTGQPTLWADAVSLAAKSLIVPPDKHKGLEDVELRYRRRYVDLWANPEAMHVLKTRFQVVAAIRRYLERRGFLEVETPMLQPIHGGAAARPFVTHHNAYDMPLYLRIAPELYLKRLLVAGLPRVFEVNRNFRNEGVSPRHNPEFTMLEAYEAFGNYETMADLVEDLVKTVAHDVLGTTTLANGVDLAGTWRRVRMDDLVREHTGWNFDKSPITDVDAERLGISDPAFHAKSPAAQLVDVFERRVEHTLVEPTFVTHVPSVIIPLARPNEDDPFFADVYELIIGGQEISPGYTELNDPDVQEQLFGDQVADDAERQQVDYDFLDALKVGMPPAGGMGLGVDRLVMLLTGQPSIRDVLAFPLMKPIRV